MRKKPVKKKTKVKRAPPLEADQALAGDLRARMIVALGPVCTILNEGAAAGLAGTFTVDTNHPDGKYHVSGVFITRVL